MVDLVKAVEHFHDKFELSYDGPPRQLPETLGVQRMDFIGEEFVEYIKAVNAGDLHAQFDALIDIVYVAIGTALMHGFPFDEGFSVVHLANMKKVQAGINNMKQGVVKPEGWEPPNLEHLL